MRNHFSNTIKIQTEVFLDSELVEVEPYQNVYNYLFDSPGLTFNLHFLTH